MPNPETLLQAWPVGAVLRVTPTEPGHNNRSWIVEAERGKYVLRLYDNLGEPAIRFEHAILTRLSDVSLPFAIPAPLETTRGGTLHQHVIPGESQRPQRAALFHCLPGAHPSAEDPLAAEPLGEALAHLHRALADIGDALGPSPIPAYGELHRIHHLIPDPLAVGRALDLPAADRARLEHSTECALEFARRLYPLLPRQLIHADYGHFNVLMDAGRVTAVLDFEFSSYDVRAIDLTRSVRAAGYGAGENGGDVEVARRFIRGYASVHPPTEDEIAAIPELIRLADVAILIHWTGRWMQGLVDRAPILGGVRRVLASTDAIDTHGPQLIETLRRAIAP